MTLIKLHTKSSKYGIKWSCHRHIQIYYSTTVPYHKHGDLLSLSDLYWIPEREELNHALVKPPVGRIRITSNNMLAVGKAHPSGGSSGRGAFSQYNGVKYSKGHTDDKYWEVHNYVLFPFIVVVRYGLIQLFLAIFTGTGAIAWLPQWQRRISVT